MTELALADAETRAKRLKAGTTDTHERLDKTIMAGRPFESRERYGRFLEVQLRFHRDIDALYQRSELAARLPDLEGRRRLAAIEADRADLGLPALTDLPPPAFAADQAPDLATALGWLYVAEGSNLGAAFLFKAAAKLGLDETLGARHLAGHPDGRAAHWRQFTAALDAADLDTAGEARAIAGAKAAFSRVQAYVDAAFR
ncbi:biliverdin-producing heme oxygenase [Caulobacter hibisci]|uniref:Biliverdin-producing heme oxygenase n=1 Tax=Caulobacter hibisci TaxID=2035993 RepID=A0ABS0SU24_9CAUL|nr:biliverdin-producing heme oxygenase [Caulobacter hibisci]MBI1683157.1 biliverdin-producing heme oxygenase [Caulobacter hibisci]